MPKKRILHLMTSLVAGGAETNLLSLLRHFDTDEFEHAVAYGGSNGALEGEFRKLDVRLVQISDTPLSVRSMFEIPKLVRKIGEYSPDLLHSHLDLPNVVGLFAKQRLGCCLVIHLHGLGLIPHDKLPGRPFKHRFWNLIARGYKRCDHVIAICNFQMPFLKNLGFRKDQITLIPNGISLKSQHYKSRTPHDPYIFVNVGRLFPQKNHDLLLRAFHGVVGQSSQAKLRLIGDGPLRAGLEEQVRQLGLQDSVEFMGVRRDIAEILSSSDCFVQSSRWELHPITILEAMRASLPVIATDVGGVRDTVVNGETGAIVESEDETGLKQAMLGMVSDEGRSRVMGEQGEKVVKERFNNEIVARRIESVYRAVLAASPRKTA